MAGCNDREELSEVIVKEVQERQLGKEGVFLKLIFEGDMRKKQQSGFKGSYFSFESTSQRGS